MALAFGKNEIELRSNLNQKGINIGEGENVILVKHHEQDKDFWAAYLVYNAEAYIHRLELENKQWKFL